MEIWKYGNMERLKYGKIEIWKDYGLIRLIIFHKMPAIPFSFLLFFISASVSAYACVNHSSASGRLSCSIACCVLVSSDDVVVCGIGVF
jgi:hypothetical protein